MFKYLFVLTIMSAGFVAQATAVGAKGHYLCLAANINKRIQELQPIYYGKEEQIEAVYCNSVKGDYIVLKENQGNLTVFKDVERVDDLIVGQTDEREIIVQPETDIYKLDEKYSKFDRSENARLIKDLTPEPTTPEVTNAGNANDNSNLLPGEAYAD